MKAEVPRAFRARLVDHNRHCWAAAGLCLFGAWISWLLLYGLYGFTALAFETIRTGNVDLKTPVWFGPLAAALAIGCLVVAALGRLRFRYQPLPDRDAIGWHMISDVLLFPARLTLAIGDHVAARVVLSEEEIQEAWHLLQDVADAGRAEFSRLGWKLNRPERLEKLLLALQLTGWIDWMHTGQGGFYRLRSDEQAVLRKLRVDPA